MVQLSTNKIYLEASSNVIFEFLSQTKNMAQIISFQKTKHLEVKDDVITFILKWAARFNFMIVEITDKHILIRSDKDVVFTSAFRFDITEEDNGSSIIVHAETDTAPFVDFYFERQMKNWVTAIADNLESQFGNC